MGVRICPQCKGKVSESRNDCPHCGYDFSKKKKCPDCQEMIDINVSVCPICGYYFEQVEKKEEPKVEPKDEVKTV